jgi:hypothetical protein
LIDTVPGTGKEAPFAEVPVGGQFEITYKFNTAIPTDPKAKAEDAGSIEPVIRGGTFTDTNNLGLVSSKADVKVENNLATVEKTERFQVKKTDQAPNGTYQINYKVVVRNPNTNEKVETGTTGKKYPTDVKSGRPPYPKKSPPPITVRVPHSGGKRTNIKEKPKW